ncbi:MAG TPA: hypothetical protein PLE77_02515 [Kiritimatiellia bacterium]|nr:hypothetical protein [Kiritimatiellia bacterium]
MSASIPETKTLVFLANVDQWNAWTAAGRGDPSGVVVVSGDFGVLRLAAASGWGSISFWKHVSVEALETCWNRSSELCRELGRYWGRPENGLAGHIAERCSIDLLYPIDAVLVLSRAVAAILDQLKPSLVVGFGDRRRVPNWDEESPPPDLFNAVVDWQCEQRGVPFQALMLGSDAEQRGDGSWGTVSGGRLLPGARVDAVFTCEGLGVREQELLFADAAERGCVDWVQLSAEAPERPVPSVDLAAVRNLPYDLRAVGDVMTALMSALSGPLPATLTEPDLFANPRLSFLWAWLAERVLLGVRYYNAGRLADDAFRPRVAVTGYDAFGLTRCFQEAFVERRVPVVAVDHAAILSSEDRRRYAGARAHVLVWGRSGTEVHRLTRDAGARIEEVGSLRVDLQPANPAVRQAGGRGKRVLLVTGLAINNLGCASCAHPAALEKTWVGLADMFRRHPDWVPAVKPHPRYDDVEYYRELARGALPGLVIEAGSPAEAIQKADVVVLVHNPSTVMFEAMQNCVPVIYLRDAVMSFVRSAVDDGLPTFSTVEELGEQVESLLTDETHRARVLADQKHFYEAQVVATGKSAVARVRNVLDELMSGVEREDVDEPSRWLLDVLAMIGSARSGALDRSGLQAQAARLVTGRPAKLRIPLLKLSRVGASLMAEIVRPDWSASAGISTWELLWTVRGLLPEEMPVCFRDIRMHAVYAITRDEVRGMHTPSKRMMLSALKYVLAPGRILAGGVEGKN